MQSRERKQARVAKSSRRGAAAPLCKPLRRRDQPSSRARVPPPSHPGGRALLPETRSRVRCPLTCHVGLPMVARGLGAVSQLPGSIPVPASKRTWGKDGSGSRPAGGGRVRPASLPGLPPLLASSPYPTPPFPGSTFKMAPAEPNVTSPRVAKRRAASG